MDSCIDKLALLHLGNGKGIYIDGNSVTQEEALEIVGSILKTWGHISL